MCSILFKCLRRHTGPRLRKHAAPRRASFPGGILRRMFAIMNRHASKNTNGGKGISTMIHYKAFMLIVLCILCAGNIAFAAEPDIQRHFDEGNSYFNEGQYGKAIESYNRVVALYPDFVQAYYNRGLAYYKAGKYDEAIADYSRVVSTTSGNADIYNNRALAYLKKGEFENAISDYTKVLALNSRYPDAYHNRGIAYANVGKFDEAIADYNRVIAINPKDPNIYLSRGVAFTKKAMEDFQRACDMGSKFACENLKQLSR